jgi:hypothetical protein
VGGCLVLSGAFGTSASPLLTHLYNINPTAPAASVRILKRLITTTRRRRRRRRLLRNLRVHSFLKLGGRDRDVPRFDTQLSACAAGRRRAIKSRIIAVVRARAFFRLHFIAQRRISRRAFCKRGMCIKETPPDSRTFAFFSPTICTELCSHRCSYALTHIHIQPGNYIYECGRSSRSHRVRAVCEERLY